MFHKQKTLNEKCLEFKKIIKGYLEESDESVAIITLTEFEKFFDYKMRDYVIHWLPQQIKAETLKVGLKMRKQRSRDIVEVSIVA